MELMVLNVGKVSRCAGGGVGVGTGGGRTCSAAKHALCTYFSPSGSILRQSVQ